jgi:DNA repair ATPase RecN
MDFVSLVPVLLPIALFVVTLIIIFSLRASDKNKHNISNVRRLYDIYKSDAESSHNSLKQFSVELEQTIANKNNEVQAMVQKVDNQLAELKEYSEDLVKLKNAMDAYKTALEGLAKLTEDADDKVSSVQADADRLDGVRTVIEGFRQDMRDADEHLRKHEQRVIQLERESVTRMNEAVSETDNSMDEAMAGLHKESQDVLTDFREKTSKDTEQRLKKIDDAFQAVIHTVQQFFGELQHKLDIVQSEEEKLSALIEKGSKLVVVQQAEIPKVESVKFETVKVEDFKPEVQKTEAPKTEAQKPEAPKPSYPVIRRADDEPVEKKLEVEITDIDYDFSQAPSYASGNKYDDFDSPEVQDDEKKWETYGEEEVVDFDDDSSN